MSSTINSVTAALPQTLTAASRIAADSNATVQAEAAKAAAKPLVNFDAKAQQQELQDAIAKLNEQMQRGSYNLSFSMDSSANCVVVKVRNQQSGDVIRQIPNEAALRFAHNLDDLKGLFKDEMS